MEFAIIVLIYFSLNILASTWIMEEAAKRGFDVNIDFKDNPAGFIAFSLTIGFFLPFIIIYSYFTTDEDDEE